MRNQKLVAPIMVAAALAGGAPEATLAQSQPALTSIDQVAYMACVLFKSGAASGYVPVQKTTGYHVYNYFESKTGERLLPGTGYTNIRCYRGDTQEAAEQARIKSGYVAAETIPWPKGFKPVPDPGAPKPVGPDQWLLCTLETGGGIGRPLAMIVFEPFLVPGAKYPLSGDVGMMFHRQVGTDTVVPGYSPFNGNGSGGCDAFGTETAARAKRDRWQYSRNYNIVKFVDWRPPELNAKTAPAKVTGTAGGPGNPNDKSGATVQPVDTSLRDAGKAWDEQVKKTLAEETKKKVELAAKQVQADAKAKADLEAFLKARRKQGSAQ